jgi:hypothetical protein
MFWRSISAVLLAGAVLSAPAFAKKPVFGFGKKPVHSGVLPGDVHGAHYLAEVGDYTEFWTHVFVFKSGHVLFARFMVTNLGIGSNKGAVIAHLIGPDGTLHEFIDGRRDSSWSYARDRLHYQLAGHSLWGDGREFRLELRNEAGARVQLSIQNVIDSYRPGRILFGEEKQDYLDFTVTSPRAIARGTFTAQGATTELDGLGYAEHLHMNYAQHRQAVSLLSFVGFTEDLTVNFTHFVTAKAFGFRRIPFLAVGKGKKIVLTANQASLSQANFWTDRRAKAKYRVPRLLKFSFKDPHSSDRVRVRVIARRELHRFDVLGRLDSFERFVVERISQPVQYRYLAEFEMTGEAGGEKLSGKGQGVLEVVHINRR